MNVERLIGALLEIRDEDLEKENIQSRIVSQRKDLFHTKLLQHA